MRLTPLMVLLIVFGSMLVLCLNFIFWHIPLLIVFCLLVSVGVILYAIILAFSKDSDFLEKEFSQEEAILPSADTVKLEIGTRRKLVKYKILYILAFICAVPASFAVCILILGYIFQDLVPSKSVEKVEKSEISEVRWDLR